MNPGSPADSTASTMPTGSCLVALAWNSAIATMGWAKTTSTSVQGMMMTSDWRNPKLRRSPRPAKSWLVARPANCGVSTPSTETTTTA